MARPRTHTDELRIQLLELAAERIASGGLGQLSLRSLAADAGTSTTAIYSLFGDKDALLQAVLAHAFQEFGAAQQQALVPGEGLESLRALGRAYLDWACAHPQMYTVMFGAFNNRTAPSPDVDSSAMASLQPLLQAVASAQQSGRLRIAPVEEVAMSFWAYAHGIASLRIMDVVPGDLEIDTDAMLRGWLASPAEGLGNHVEAEDRDDDA